MDIFFRGILSGWPQVLTDEIRKWLFVARQQSYSTNVVLKCHIQGAPLKSISHHSFHQILSLSGRWKFPLDPSLKIEAFPFQITFLTASTIQ